MKIIILSNGRGEDQLAVTFLKSFVQNAPVDNFTIEAVPFVGEGSAYRKNGIAVARYWPEMPSGGFLSLNLKAWFKDLKNGLFTQIFSQFSWARKHIPDYDAVITVGDFTTVMMLSLIKHPMHFHIDTALSSYLRKFFSIETAALRKHCEAVFVRDNKTNTELRDEKVNSFFEGSTMLDDENMKSSMLKTTIEEKNEILLMPSSRADAFQNIERFLEIINQNTFSNRFILTLSPNADVQKVNSLLKIHQFEKNNENGKEFFVNKNGSRILVNTGPLGDLTGIAKAAVGMSGTGCEQVAAFGVPLFLIQTRLPQSDKKRMAHYRKLLGNCCEILRGKPAEQAQNLQKFLDNPVKLAEMAALGPERFGKPGACDRIAEIIWNLLIKK